jgi:hercynylcysteine S-oxide lyase
MNYGKSLLKEAFALRTDLINFNHGSFGACPKEVMEKHISFLYEQEGSSEIWFRKTYYDYIDESRKQVAKLIKANVDEVVLVENASYAINSILRSWPFKVSRKRRFTLH